MASGRRARLERLLKAIEDAENGWLHDRGLASLLVWDKAYPEPDDHDDGDDTDCAGAPGLRGLLYYVDPRTERPSDYVTD